MAALIILYYFEIRILNKNDNNGDWILFSIETQRFRISYDHALSLSVGNFNTCEIILPNSLILRENT